METRSDNKLSADRRRANKRVDSLVGYVSSVAAACLILMWSVFNTWLNVLKYWAARGEENDAAQKLAGESPAWELTALMVLITCVIPFLFGLLILFRAIIAAGKKSG